MGGVFVVGSINQDFVLEVTRRPESGEIVTDAEPCSFPAPTAASGRTRSRP